MLKSLSTSVPSQLRRASALQGHPLIGAPASPTASRGVQPPVARASAVPFGPSPASILRARNDRVAVPQVGRGPGERNGAPAAANRPGVARAAAAAAPGAPVPLPRGTKFLIVGAGPAGTTAASILKQNGYAATVLEKSDEIGGKCNTTRNGTDMGAIAWTRGYYRQVIGTSDRLDVPRDQRMGYTAYGADGRPSQDAGILEKAQTAEQFLRYALRHVLAWGGIRGPAIRDVPEDLKHVSWDQLMQQFPQLGARLKVPTTSFGYHHDTPAPYNAKYMNPECLTNMAIHGTGLWEGGTQQIWQKLVEKEALDVRTGMEIRKIERGERVRVEAATKDGKDHTFTADRLILACNPKHLVDVLGLPRGSAERDHYEQIQTLDYRTYEVQIDKLKEGEASYGTWDANLDQLNRPVLFGKRDADRNFFVVYVNARPGTPDAEIKANICRDVALIGGENVRFRAVRHWEYMPHADVQAIEGGFFQRGNALQGKNKTVVVGSGSGLIQDILPDVLRQTTDVVESLIAGKLEP